MCEGGNASVKKTADLRGGVCEPFSSACALASIARVLPKGSLWDDSEKLSLLLSLASEKEEIGYGYSKRDTAVTCYRNDLRFGNYYDSDFVRHSSLQRRHDGGAIV